jgi:flavin-dependent dehydrogenase
MGHETDVFIIGGGPVGLAAAIAIREKGFNVTVADGVMPPIDKACGEGLMPDAVAALRMLGVNLEKSDGQAFRGIRFIENQKRVLADFPKGQGIGVRRTVLHEKIVERARACGISLLWNTPVVGISSGGVMLTRGVIAAKWIVGADGSNSRVRRWTGLEAHREHKRRFACRRHFHVKPWSDRAEVYWGQGAQAYVTAVGKEEVCVALISRRPDMQFTETLREFPELVSRLESAERVGGERGAVTAMHSLKRVYRGNVALIGDASGGVDAITGDGLCLGFCQAKALAEALVSGRLSEYQKAHRRLGRRAAWMGRLLLLLDARVSLRRRVLRAFETEPSVFERLLAIHVGETSTAYLASTVAQFSWLFLTA